MKERLKILGFTALFVAFPLIALILSVCVSDGSTGSGTINDNQVLTVVLNVDNESTWNAAIKRIRNGGNNKDYIINVTGIVNVPAIKVNRRLFSINEGINVIIQGGGTLVWIDDEASSFIGIGKGQTVTLRNVTLQGISEYNDGIVTIMRDGLFCMEESSLITNNIGVGVFVDGGGNFTMKGGTISGNRGVGVFVSYGTFNMQGGSISGNNGGGVYIRGGIFVMQDGIISDNITGWGGGGVYIDSGTFTMQEGKISGNKGGRGGGVLVSSGTFNMQGGTISSNTASYLGGGVFIYWNVNFTKTGGIIIGNDEYSSTCNRSIADDKGHAIYSAGGAGGWRNTTAGPNDYSDDYGFWQYH
jgi:hypothetical protein